MHNWAQIHQHVSLYAKRMAEQASRIQTAVQQSLAVFHDDICPQWDTWKNQALQSTPHLVPDFEENPSTTYPVDTHPAPGIILASDGSQIFPSRHETAPLALITVSRIRIDYAHYQDMPLMDSLAWVFMQEDLLNEKEKDQGREIAFNDLVSDKRALLELETLANLAGDISASRSPCVAFVDGSLILWRLAERFKEEYEKDIIQQYVSQLARFQEMQIPLAAYTSRSGSREVSRFIQWVMDQKQTRGNPETGSLPLYTDTALFQHILKEGERSILFHSQSKIVIQNYSLQKISYFYLHVGNEIAKIEIPRWIAQNPSLVDQVASSCFHQAQLGGGYPVVLSEAHEQAVVRGPERETFFMLVEDELRRVGIHTQYSAKQQSKQFRKV